MSHVGGGGFLGFEALSGNLGYVPASVQSSSATASAAECSDGELRMVMKRMTKRDGTTKLKVSVTTVIRLKNQVHRLIGRRTVTAYCSYILVILFYRPYRTLRKYVRIERRM